MMKLQLTLIGLVSSLCFSQHAQAENTRFFNLEGFGSFLDGDPETTAVSEDGAITLPHQVSSLHSAPEAVFSAATLLTTRLPSQK